MLAANRRSVEGAGDKRLSHPGLESTDLWTLLSMC
jgi:hypothetical protein